MHRPLAFANIFAAFSSLKLFKQPCCPSSQSLQRHALPKLVTNEVATATIVVPLMKLTMNLLI
jgi:hypothetical protein